ncbi:MAG TPA: GntR family transcriptional regulator [Actinomycetes bacterium]|nr:GntR family transcriptional regulator [Actinomycetes bacterium]
MSSLQPLRLQSTPELIADQIREGILNGTFPPHHQLGEVELARQLQVSRGPVREAMQRLIQEGLLRGERNRGVFVVELDDDDARDIYLARAAVEKAAAVLVARRADPDDLATIGAVLGRLRRAVSASWVEMVESDLEFHATIVDCSHSERLQRMFRTLAAETRLCLLRLERFYPVRESVVTEHEEILSAIRAGDEALLTQLIDHHMHEAAARLSLPADPTSKELQAP